MPIKITEYAIREIRKILLDPSQEGRHVLRIAIKGGGCAGFTYTMDLCRGPEAHDVIHESHGLQIICDRVSNLYLDGMTIDFTDDPLQRGFVFNNPNARTTCLCGTSFGI